MQKQWKEQIETKEPKRYMTLAQQFQTVTSENSILQYKKEGSHYVVEFEGMNFLLSSVWKSAEGKLIDDIFVYLEKRRGDVENHVTLILDRQDDWVVHRHNFYEVIYVMYGKIVQRVSGKELTINENEVLILNQNVKHKERFTDDAIVLYADCSEEIMKAIVDECRLSGEMMDFFRREDQERQEYVHFIPRKKRLVNMIVDQLLDEQCNDNAGKRWMTLGLMARLLTVLDDKEAYEFNAFSEDLSTNARTFKELERYLEQQNWNVEKGELAKKFHYNEHYLSQVMKKMTGMSLVNYCVEHKLSRVEYLLSYSETSVNEIINQMGYQNKTYFYRKFKQKYGVTPQEMRQNIQKGH